ncbi:hypothetical protein BU25DRAFT_353987 [Macroventuria anomochaeta]|uniref:Uncharacterized protein n=1 Tax=Macroventuria anomochaeta TaxID=301207 RepID=A0ACB6RKH2_9PLEO|nr:uncharacterized protein BU25DRAFT_353987 [Macroventuria anomochaeta]KAF2621593.1 hypothetical protein BU25DRAFT_353987 [Macroventuria anomochaeta]
MNLSTKLLAEAPTRSRAQNTAAAAPETKPRKANSEVRKQQNRIASRNYREKRKRKLQQLQQLLEDDDLGDQQGHTRSTSPYDDWSCSGSVRYERSIASSSPHITVLPGNFSSPQSDHATIPEQAWSTAVTSATEEPLLYTHPYYEPFLQTTAHNVGTSTATSYPAWNTIPWTAGTGYSTPNVSYHSTYPSHASLWPPSGFETMYAHAVHQQQAVSSTSSYVPSWQYHASEELPAGIALDPYGRRYHPYEPC